MKTKPIHRPFPRRAFLQASAAGAAGLLCNVNLLAAEPDRFNFDPTENIIKAPDDPALWPAYREKLAAWRIQRSKELNYSDALYVRPDFSWVSSSYACYVWMLFDARFYDPRTGRLDVAKLIAFTRSEFGHVDSVVLWHAYPRIGLDDRNQFDFYREQPGGIDGLRKVVDELHAANIRVYINYNPWDKGTRREGKDDIDMLCEMVGAMGIDGIFLDTMKEGATGLREKLDSTRAGVALEGEVALPTERIADHHFAWAQGFKDSHAPGVVRNKWFERRHMLHHVQRWGFDRTAFFQTAFMNGTGTMVWDNVFGSWMGYSKREKSMMKTMLPIQRRYTALFSGERWTPLVPVSMPQGIKTPHAFANLWEADGIRLWTIVNRLQSELSMELLEAALKPGEQLWDLVTGKEVKSTYTILRPRDIGCFIAARRSALGADFDLFLARQKATAAAADGCANYPALQPALTIPPPTTAFSAAKLPPEMAAILTRSGGDYHWGVQFRVRECGLYESNPLNTIFDMSRINDLLPVVWRDIVLSPYALDLTPVTNAQFARFIQTSGYQPAIKENFLKHWKNGAPPAGQDDHPVVYVSLDDARAYAKWAGKRLPTEAEWQYAAEGKEQRRYPWGDADPKSDTALCNNGDNGRGTTPVKQFPKGRSPFGIYDMAGNTWEWTESERSDGVNHFSIIRGGAFYKAKGSIWYMDGGAVANNLATKFIHMWPGLDRCATVGFRCVVDLA
jgi:formylglycine-generating enzyme required for sulfatase activity